MAFWNKNKKKNQELKNNSIKNNNQETANLNFDNNPKVINQQSSRFSVNPEIFDYEKIKLNPFLTDSEEYNRKKLIDDLPNKDPRYLNKSIDQIEIEQRMMKDEKTFNNIYTNLNKNNYYNDFDLKNIKNKAIDNVNYLNKDEIRYPIKTNSIDREFYKDVGKSLDENIEKISNETKQFLNQMHTKILDINNLCDGPLINKAVDYKKGGYQTTNPYEVSNINVNSYQKLKEDYDQRYANVNDNIITQQDFNHLNSYQVNQTNINNNINNDALNLRTKNLNNFQESNVDKTFKNSTLEFNQFNNDALENISLKTNSCNNNINTNNIIKTNKLIDEAKTIDEIYTREITKEAQNYEINHQATKESLNDILNNKDFVINNFENNNTNTKSKAVNNELKYLIPVNEIKLDLRIRKADRRNFIFNKQGQF